MNEKLARPVDRARQQLCPMISQDHERKCVADECAWWVDCGERLTGEKVTVEEPKVTGKSVTRRVELTEKTGYCGAVHP